MNNRPHIRASRGIGPRNSAQNHSRGPTSYVILRPHPIDADSCQLRGAPDSWRDSDRRSRSGWWVAGPVVTRFTAGETTCLSRHACSGGFPAPQGLKAQERTYRLSIIESNLCSDASRPSPVLRGTRDPRRQGAGVWRTDRSSGSPSIPVGWQPLLQRLKNVRSRFTRIPTLGSGVARGTAPGRTIDVGLE
jgi:hypothetical protein